jgi:serine/threonine-protein kinase
MAVVYQATDRKLKRRVALKVLPPELAFREDVRSRFLREAQTAARLNHPHIVPIYAVDERDGLVWFAMGLVEGEPLAALLAREPQLPLDTVRRTLSQVADALAYAHAHGVVHRDVKPDNVLLDRVTGRALVTDFGIARAAEGDQRLTVTGSTVGTPAYMSPEQATGERDIDARSDIYSLGVVGYQLLAGRPPFTAANTPAMLMKHVSETPAPLVTLRPDAPRDLVEAIEVALRKSRDSRWGTAALFRDALGGGEAARAAFAAVPRVGGGAPAPAAAVDARRAAADALGRAVPPLPPGFSPPPLEPPRQPGMTREAHQQLLGEWALARDAWEREQVALREGYRQQALALRDEGRAMRREWREAVRDGLVTPAGGPMGSALPVPLAVRVASFQRKAVMNGAVVSMLAGINLLTSPGFPWFLFPTMGMGIDLLNRYWRLRDAGVRFADALRGRVTPGAQDPMATALAAVAPGRPAPGAAPTTPSAIDRELESFAPAIAQSRDPFLREGKAYQTVRNAAADRIAIRETVGRLSEADRALIPDAMPTVDGLCQRIASLAQSLARVDHDLAGNVRAELEEKLVALGREPATAETARRRALLERQQASLDDLASRREGFARQLEHASIALRTLRLDLAKLQTSGVGAAIGDVSSATQEARALSADIARALDVADEVRRI